METVVWVQVLQGPVNLLLYCLKQSDLLTPQHIKAGFVFCLLSFVFLNFMLQLARDIV